MIYRTFEIKCTNYQTLDTELLFDIASARAENAEIVKFIFNFDTVKNVSYILRFLKNQKKLGKIQLFEISEKIYSDSTEARYLRNKYAELINKCTEDTYVLIKL